MHTVQSSIPEPRGLSPDARHCVVCGLHCALYPEPQEGFLEGGGSGYQRHARVLIQDVFTCPCWEMGQDMVLGLGPESFREERNTEGGGRAQDGWRAIGGRSRRPVRLRTAPPPGAGGGKEDPPLSHRGSTRHPGCESAPVRPQGCICRVRMEALAQAPMRARGSGAVSCSRHGGVLPWAPSPRLASLLCPNLRITDTSEVTSDFLSIS